MENGFAITSSTELIVPVIMLSCPLSVMMSKATLDTDCLMRHAGATPSIPGTS